MKLAWRTCACGCGSRFRTTREKDQFASLFCQSLATGVDYDTLEGRFRKKSLPKLPDGISGQVTAKELARILKVGVQNIYNWTMQGRITPCSREPRRHLYDLSQVRTALNPHPEMDA